MTETKIGSEVYDEDGEPIGTVKGFNSAGFFVASDSVPEGVDTERETSPAFGDAEILWRCAGCGEVGEIDDGLPGGCPSCDAPKTDLYYWTEAYD